MYKVIIVEDEKHAPNESHGSLRSYVIGCVLSLILTAIPLMVR